MCDTFHMKLDHYLKTNAISDSAFAAAIGVHRSHVSKLRAYRVGCSLQLATKIERVTMRAVKPEDLIPDQLETQGDTQHE